MTNEKVKVIADKYGSIISVSPNNPEYGYIRVEQVANVINSEGWLRKTRRTALIKGTIKDLEDAKFEKGQELPGKIVVIESFKPFYAQNPDRDLKIAGDSGVVCRVDDQPIYRQTFYTPDENAKDELIMHNNGDEIREVNAATRALSILSPREEEALADL